MLSTASRPHGRRDPIPYLIGKRIRQRLVAIDVAVAAE
jgi:hypothetical protein